MPPPPLPPPIHPTLPSVPPRSHTPFQHTLPPLVSTPPTRPPTPLPHSQDNLEFMQWFKRFHEINYNAPEGEYDALARRKMGKGGYD